MSRNKRLAVKQTGARERKISTRDIPDLYSEAIQNFNTGKIEEAGKICRKILSINHYHADSLHLLGIVLRYADKREEAIELIKKAIRIKNDLPYYHNSIGNILHELGRHEEAMPYYYRAIALAPDHAEPHSNLGTIFREKGEYEKAIACYQKALSLKPGFAEAHLNLGIVFNEQEKFIEALSCFRNALAIKPDYAEAHFNAGIAIKSLGDEAAAFQSFRKAIALDPKNNQFWVHMAKTMMSLVFHSLDDELMGEMLLALDQQIVSPSMIRNAVLSALRHHPTISQLMESTSGTKLQEVSYSSNSARLSEIPLLLKIISLAPVVTREFEALLTCMRRALIVEVDKDKVEIDGLPFTAALAQQCFINEYVFFETDEEKEAVKRLQEKITTFVSNNQELPLICLVALACYRPLFKFSWAENLINREWPDEIKAVIKQQIEEPFEEIKLRPSIYSLTGVEDEISQAVQAQYEENPYPRWTRARLEPVGLPVEKVMQGIFPHRDWSNLQISSSPEILVAGTGTGEHALTVATRFVNSRVLAVDLSLSSLCYAVRKTREIGIKNIEYAQADILELGKIGRMFDIVDSTGVLHHMKNPIAGWRVLTNLLRPGGLMKIGLYSEIARQSIIRARAMIAEKGYSSTPDDIRCCRRYIVYETEDPELKEVPSFRDFYSLSECRDLIFHVQEHRFTLPQIEAALQELGLEFIGFELSNTDAMRKFSAINPGLEALASLSLWDEFEKMNPSLFRGMYQFWCRKK